MESIDSLISHESHEGFRGVQSKSLVDIIQLECLSQSSCMLRITNGLAEGKIRARYRNSTKKAEMLKPGEIYEYTLDLWQTGITIPTDHRLRVEVASASFPLFSRNLNTGGHNETETDYVPAEQVIYHDTKHPSHVLLPVIP